MPCNDPLGTPHQTDKYYWTWCEPTVVGERAAVSRRARKQQAKAVVPAIGNGSNASEMLEEASTDIVQGSDISAATWYQLP